MSRNTSRVTMTKITSITQAEQSFQNQRDKCLKGMTRDIPDCLMEIAAFYERASLKGRAKAITGTMERIMTILEKKYKDGYEWEAVLTELNHIALGPDEVQENRSWFYR